MCILEILRIRQFQDRGTVAACVWTVQEKPNSCSVARYTVVTIKALDFRHISPSMGHPQGEYINIGVWRML
jgi:hypothetical protein